MKKSSKKYKPKSVTEKRMRVSWGVFNGAGKQVAVYSYTDRRKAFDKVATLGPPHFMRKIKEAL